MKIFRKLCAVLLLPLLAVSCIKTPDGPPVNPPSYTGPEPNITIAELKNKFSTTETTPIEFEYIFRATITANDESGNIYKQLYLEDGTGAIVVGVDQNSMYATHRVGQNVVVNTIGLAMVVYGGEQQLGFDGTNANRIPWEIFQEKVQKDGWPNASNAVPQVETINGLAASDVNKLVTFKNVYFEEVEGLNYATDSGYGEHRLIDGAGNGIVVRSSNYASFAKTPLPEELLDVTGVLGRFNGTWQFLIRTLDDVKVVGPAPDREGGTTPPGGGDVIFKETFGEGTYTYPDQPKIADFTKFDEGAPVKYEDQSGAVDIRTTSNLNPHAWFPSGRDAYLTISGINTDGYDDLVLTFDLACNNIDNSPDLGSIMQVTWNGTVLPLASQVATATNTYYKFTVSSGLTSATDNTLQFYASSTANTVGIRLDNIVIMADGEGSTTPPPSGNDFFLETFGTLPSTNASDRKKIDEYTGYAMGSPVQYNDPTGRTDIRATTRFDAHVWLPAPTQDGSATDASLIISGINTSGKQNVTLSFDITANVSTYADGVPQMNLNVLRLVVDGTTLTIPSTLLTGADGDQNSYRNLTFSNIPAKDDLTIEFHTTSTNEAGLRIDNIKLSGE